MVGIPSTGTSILILAIVIALTFAAPLVALVPTRGARHASVMLAIVSGVCLYLAVDEDPNDRLGLVSLVNYVLLVFWLASVAVAIVAIIFRRRRDGEPTLAGNFLFGLAAGLPIPLLLLLKIGIFSRMPGALLVVVLGAAAAFLVHQTFRGLKDSRWVRPFDAYGCTCLSAALAIAFSLVLGYISAATVARKAAEVAAGRPYCLQSGDRTVTGLLDLSMLTFRQRKQGFGAAPAYLRNHGLLVIATEDGLKAMNWSYGAQAFMPEALAESPNVSARPQSLCSPAQAPVPTAG